MSRTVPPSTAAEPLKIGLVGDSGVDACVIESTDHDPEDHDAVTLPFERRIEVPSGAFFVQTALNRVLNSDDPKDAGASWPCELVPGEHVEEKGHSRQATQARIVLRAYAPPQALKGSRQSAEVWRIASRVPQKHFLSSSRTAHAGTQAPSYWAARFGGDLPDILLITDCGRAWRRSDGEELSHLLNRMKARHEQEGRSGPFAIVDLDRRPPRPLTRTLRESGPERVFMGDDPIWDILLEHRDNICVMCTSVQLRNADAAVSRHISWELSIETLAAEMRLFDSLSALAMFRHLVVRFGCVAAVHFQRTERVLQLDDAARNIRGQLIFSPNARDGVYRYAANDGEVVGLKTLLAASLLVELGRRPADGNAQVESELLNERFADALRAGLLAGMRLFDAGYPVHRLRPPDPLTFGEDFLSESFNPAAGPVRRGYLCWRKENAKALRPEHTLGVAQIPQEVLDPAQRPLANFGMSNSEEARWEILRETLNALGAPSPTRIGQSPSAASLTWRINIAMAIVRYGHEAVLNRELRSRDGRLDDADDGKGVREICVALDHAERWKGFAGIHDCLTLRPGDLPDIPSPGSVHPQQKPQWQVGVYTPVIQFGEMYLTERNEIESFRSVRNGMREYTVRAGQGGVNRPMSIAVFGPPGTGKSFAIKQLRDSVNGSLTRKQRKLEALEFNVAQFRGVGDLEQAATAISNVNHQGAIPLVFFDEFDGTCNGEPLGWLRYFLAPMQDGNIGSASDPIRLGPAVLVFAGGVYSCFSDFVPSRVSGREPDPIAVEAFRLRKGPDFVSRLSHHIDILPIDTAPGDHKVVIRRAILLRGILKRRGLVGDRNQLEVARIDEDVLYALLTVDRYRHGIRSLETIVNMCSTPSDRIDKASLPARSQLDMHVDAQEFMVRMYRGRVRRTPVQTRSGTTPSPPTHEARRSTDPDCPDPQREIAGSTARPRARRESPATPRNQEKRRGRRG